MPDNVSANISNTILNGCHMTLCYSKYSEAAVQKCSVKNVFLEIS